MDSSNGSGIQDPLCLSTQTMETETHKSKVARRHQFYKQSNFKTSNERSNQNCTGSAQPVHFNTVCGETNLKRKANFQLKEFESVCRNLLVQDGGSGRSTQAHSTRRLYDEVRPTRRLFFRSNSRQLQELSAVHLSGNHLRVPVPSIRAIQRTQDIHKTVETDRSTTSIPGNTHCYIPGRYADSGPESRETVLSVPQHCGSATTTGVSHQTREMLNSLFSQPGEL